MVKVLVAARNWLHFLGSFPRLLSFTNNGQICSVETCLAFPRDKPFAIDGYYCLVIIVMIQLGARDSETIVRVVPSRTGMLRKSERVSLFEVQVSKDRSR